MSEENVELVRRSLESFNRGDLDALSSDLHPEVEWYDQRELPGATVHHGREATVEHLRSALRDMPGYRVEPAEIIDAGDKVVVCGQVFARGRASEVPVERPYFSVTTVQDGHALSVRLFGTRIEALEAAGLSE
jgi:uncharacterized protein